jgi:hypothetical protein
MVVVILSCTGAATATFENIVVDFFHTFSRKVECRLLLLLSFMSREVRLVFPFDRNK